MDYRHYLILDPSGDEPLWVLAHIEQARRARLDAAGYPAKGDWKATMDWVNETLGRTGWLRAVDGVSGDVRICQVRTDITRLDLGAGP
ncbi:MAG: hypothetical protein GEV03_05180 [Streptosporangiales bacterium]|nr:hypothetical protein [Streptosporangiales bacterium]